MHFGSLQHSPCVTCFDSLTNFMIFKCECVSGVKAYKCNWDQKDSTSNWAILWFSICLDILVHCSRRHWDDKTRNEVIQNKKCIKIALFPFQGWKVNFLLPHSMYFGSLQHSLYFMLVLAFLCFTVDVGKMVRQELNRHHKQCKHHLKVILTQDSPCRMQ